jgi:hypothetical protein
VNVGQSPSRKAHFCDRHHIASANTGANHVLVGWAAYAARSMVLPNSAPRWWGFLCAILGNASPQRTMVSPRRVIDQIEENLTIKVSAPFTTCVALSHPQPLKGWHPSAVRARRRGGYFATTFLRPRSLVSVAQAQHLVRASVRTTRGMRIVHRLRAGQRGKLGHIKRDAAHVARLTQHDVIPSNGGTRAAQGIPSRRNLAGRSRRRLAAGGHRQRKRAWPARRGERQQRVS